ncbi:hypothetical protein [Microcoleus sp.]
MDISRNQPDFGRDGPWGSETWFLGKSRFAGEISRRKPGFGRDFLVGS